VAVLGWKLGRGVRLGAANESNRRRVAEIVEGVPGCAEKLSSFHWRHDGGGDDCGVGFEHFDWSLVFVCFWRPGGPDVGFSIFAAAYHVPSIVTK